MRDYLEQIAHPKAAYREGIDWDCVPKLPGKIGSYRRDCVAIDASAAIVRDVPTSMVAYGVPARAVSPAPNKPDF